MTNMITESAEKQMKKDIEELLLKIKPIIATLERYVEELNA